MVKRQDLNPSQSKAMADLISKLSQATRSKATHPAGVKDLGNEGDVVWTRPDGSLAVSLRDMDYQLQEAQERIDEATQDLAVSQQQLDEATAAADAAQARLDALDDTTLPAIRDEVAAQAEAAQQQLSELQDRLGDFATGDELQQVRTDLTDARAVADSARTSAQEANTAANAASQAALEAAGIAASKGRVIIQQQEPTGDDRQAANIWVQPAVDDPDTEVVETATTYVYIVESDEWVTTTSDDLAQAAQNALDAREAAQQAQQRADTAASNAATAQAAAEAAQRTADDATLDARDAHNEAVAAAEKIQAKIDSGDSLVLNGSFENGDLGWPEDGSHGGRSRIIEDPDAHSGDHVLELTPNIANAYPESDEYAVQAGQIIHARGWFKYLGGDAEGRLGLLYRMLDKDGTILATSYFGGSTGWKYTRDLVEGVWVETSGDATVPAGAVRMRAAFHASGPSSDLVHADDLQVVDVTEARLTQQRADEAYAEAASKLDESQVDAKILASANGKNSVTISASEPTASTPGVIVGDIWWLVGGDYNVIGQWTWAGANWTPRQIRSEVVANLDVHKLTVSGTAKIDEAVVDKLFADIFAANKITAGEITVPALDANGDLASGSATGTVIKDGAVSTSKLTVTEQMTAKLASFMSTETKKLIVSDEAILNHATLIGQTVVDDINVQGKLIGTDGVFTGTVDFDRINVTGEAILNKLGANSIEASMVKGGSFSGKTFTGGSYVGGQFKTSEEPFTDGGVQIDENYGIRGWGPGSSWRNPTFRIDGDTNFMSGTIATAPSGAAVIMTPITSSGGGGGVWFSQDGSTDGDQAAIYSKLDGNIHIRPMSGKASGTVFVDGNFVVNDKATFSGNVQGARLITDEYVVGGPGSASLRLRNDGSPQLVSKAVYDRTYSNSANVYVTSYGTIARVTSSRRYKKNIADWNPEAHRVLALQPRQWQHHDPEHNPEIDETWHVGFVAEEVNDLGLNQLVKYEGDGKGGWVPDGLNYDRFAAAQQVVIREHEARINVLEALVQNLTKE